MTDLLEDRSSHLLVRHDNGDVELLPKSDRNVLLYRHDLFGFLRHGTDTLTFAHPNPNRNHDDITFVPAGEDIRVQWRGDEFIIGQHHRPAFLDVLSRAFEYDDPDGRYATVAGWLHDLLDVEVDRNRVAPLLDHPAIEPHVEPRLDGWVLYDYILVTFDNEVYHKHHGGKDTREHSSPNVPTGEKKQAWLLTTGDPDAQNPPPLSSAADSPEEEFIARVLWCLDHLPQRPV